MRISLAATSAACVSSLCFLSSAALAAPLYQVTNLHTPYAFELSSDGTVYVQNAGKTPTYSVIRNNQWKPLSLPARSVLVDVSDHGYLLGKSAAGTYFTQSSAGVRTTLGRVAGSGANQPGVINDSGTVAGAAYYGSVASLAIWKNGVPTLSHTAVTGISAMNNGGVVAAANGYNAYLVNQGLLKRVPGPTAYHQMITDVSDNNVAVGNLFDPKTGLGAAAVWSGSKYTRAGRLAGDSSAFLLDINDGGKAVGFSYGPTNRATFWDGAALLDLNKLIMPAAGVKLIFATTVNDSGQILAHGTLNGHETTFLLRPQASASAAFAVSAVPEPTAFAGIALAAFVGLRRRR